MQVGASFNYDVRRNPTFGQAHWSKDLPGGLAEDLAVHLLAVLIHLLGAPRHTFSVSRPNAVVPNGKSADVRAVVEAERGLGSIAVSLRALPDMALIDIWCERVMLRVNISSMTLTVERTLPVKRSIARGLANFDLATQLVGSTLGLDVETVAPESRRLLRHRPDDPRLLRCARKRPAGSGGPRRGHSSGRRARVIFGLRHPQRR